ncbi:adenylosuccinate lyase [Cyclospora cayetanensis]|uniref:Adenylosuccinate lyase n=1 Tax=Cyclospora cayetanensis TaxID=88456 RepID=A0A1D3CZ00_9EIME|nr:adenylosuccinate lyase [Cyclospora cayetanensis]
MALFANICPLDGRYREATDDIRRVWGDIHLMRHRVFIELKWLEFYLDHVHSEGPMTDKQRQALQPLYEVTEEDLARISTFEKQTNHDVKAVEYYIRERLSAVPCLSSLKEYVHIFCTSEDINNLAYALMATKANTEALLPSMRWLINELQRMAAEHAETPLLARTHGQPATPTTFGKEFAVYCHRLSKHMQKLEALRPCGKFNGAVGNFNAHVVAFPDKHWPELAQTFVEVCVVRLFGRWKGEKQPWFESSIEQQERGFTRHSLASELLVLRRAELEVGSSTMPHKINPIDFENAEGNLGLANAMLRFFSGKLPVSRLQRDLSDTTCLRSLGCALGYSLLGIKSCLRGFKKTTVSAVSARKELQLHWEVLAEPVQSVMRSAKGRRWGRRCITFDLGRGPAQLDYLPVHVASAALEAGTHTAREDSCRRHSLSSLAKAFTRIWQGKQVTGREVQERQKARELPTQERAQKDKEWTCRPRRVVGRL